MPEPKGLFFNSVLEELKVCWNVDPEDLNRVPQQGAVMFVANHPFGAIDGMILAAMMHEVRPDIKLLANLMLEKIPEAAEVCFFVDPFGKKNSVRNNLKTMREALTWLKQGGSLGCFPSGEVAQWNFLHHQLQEAAWEKNLARMARKTGATVVPVYFAGRNSMAFQILGKLHPFVRLALMPKEMINKQYITVNIKIGSPIKASRFSQYPDDNKLIAYLRHRTLLLAHRNLEDPKPAAQRSFHPAPVIEPIDPNLLIREVQGLKKSQKLTGSGDLEVHIAEASEIPNLLLEIGRLRELTFRAVGEGTGTCVDLDIFDEYYLHLFLWDKKENQLIGAYRLGEASNIIAKFRKKGFYSHTLFKFKTAFFTEIGEALELGRSFIRGESQRSFTPLMLLWKGIAVYISQNKEIRALFGPVSISTSYQSLSREMMIDYFNRNKELKKLQELVKPRLPLKLKDLKKTGLNLDTAAFSLEQLADSIKELEQGEKSIPILMKQYIKLGGRFLGFNRDPKFGDCVDGLVLVDLLHTERRNLAKYLGTEEAAAFLQYHKSKDSRLIGSNLRPQET